MSLNRNWKVTSLRKEKKTKELKWEKKSKELKWELELEEANKSFYLCSIEHSKPWPAYVVRTVKLSDLLSYSPADDDPVPLHQVAYEAGSHLPGSVGCGVLGSQIVFTGGFSPISRYGFGISNYNKLVWHTNVYAFERHTNSKEIRKLDANLQGPKLDPLTVELGGKLYALSYWKVGGVEIHAPSFEVFDPKIGKWEGLPEPPFFDYGSPYYEAGTLTCAITGTKIFACQVGNGEEYCCPVFCFDVAHPDREWRLVHTMCQGGPFPFESQALVLDLPGDDDDDKKLVVGYTVEPWRLLVYLMSLSENQETITKIGDMRLPKLPAELGEPQCCKLLHIGGQKACLVVAEIELPEEDAPPCNELGTHENHGAVIPFQFELDMTKDNNNCLTLQFMPLRTFKYHTNPSTLPQPEVVGCFLL